MDNVDNVDKSIKIRRGHSFNENNLMVLPIFSLKKKRVTEIKKKWYRGDVEVGITVVGSARRGVPTIHELDTLMALFRLATKSIDNKILIENDKPINIPRVIHFSYRKLAKEMGLKAWGMKTKNRLEEYIRCLIETTIYSDLAFKDQSIGKYIIDFNGQESCRILKNYKAYSVTKRKKMGEGLLSPYEVEEHQSVEIDDFFYNNICNNYFKLYDYEQYLLLNKAISKRLFLILSTWSHGNEKYLSLDTIYSYLGLSEEVKIKKNKYYYDRLLKESLNELKKIGFIHNYIFKKDSGITFIFNKNYRVLYNLDKYNSEIDIITRLRELGVEYEDIFKYVSKDTIDYIRPLMRYIDYRLDKGDVKDIKSFILKGLIYNNYDVEQFRTRLDH